MIGGQDSTKDDYNQVLYRRQSSVFRKNQNTLDERKD